MNLNITCIRLSIVRTIGLPFPDRRDGHGKEDREGDDLEHIAARHAVDHACRKNVDDSFEERLRMGVRDGVDDVVRPGHQFHAHAGLGEVDHGQTDEKCGRGCDLEVDDRLQPHSTDFFQVPRARDPRDNGRENQWGDDCLDQVEEDIAEEIDLVSPIGPEPADETADDETDQDLDGQRWTIPAGRRGVFTLVLRGESE